MYTYEVSKVRLNYDRKELQKLQQGMLNIQCLLYEIKKVTEGKE